MPKQLTTPKAFVDLAKRSDAKWVKVKKVNDDLTKFKLRTTKYLYTLSVKPKFVDLVQQSIPDTLEIRFVDKKEE